MAEALHDGGNCPVAPTTPIRPTYRGPADPAKGIRITFAPAGRLDWSHDGGPDDIIGYEVVPEPSSRKVGA